MLSIIFAAEGALEAGTPDLHDAAGLPRRLERRYSVSILIPKMAETALLQTFVMNHFPFIEQALQQARCRVGNILSSWNGHHPQASTRSSSTSSTGSGSRASGGGGTLKEAAAAAAASIVRSSSLLDVSAAGALKDAVAAFASTRSSASNTSDGDGNGSKGSSGRRRRRSARHPPLQHNEDLAAALDAMITTVTSLFTATRLQCPAWLDINTFKAAKPRKAVAHNVSRSLVLLLNKSKRVGADFFLSKVLTGVLANHVGWIPSVVPAASTASEQGARSGCLEQTAQAAQLNDLVGATATRASVCRTIVVGEDAVAVGHMLQLLSYFIRCNEVFNGQINDLDMEDCPVAKIASEEDGAAAVPLPAGSTHDQAWPGTMPGATVVGKHPIETISTSPDSTETYDKDCMGTGARDTWFAANFGRSLLGHICDSVVPGLVLQGLAEPPAEEAILADVQTSLQFSAIDRPVASAASLMINLDLLTVERVQAWRSEASAEATGSSNAAHAAHAPLVRFSRSLPAASGLVTSMLAAFESLISMECDAEFCIQLLEDRLREIWMQSRLFAAAADKHRANRTASTPRTTKSAMMASLDMDERDFGLLYSLAGSHTYLKDWLDPHK